MNLKINKFTKKGKYYFLSIIKKLDIVLTPKIKKRESILLSKLKERRCYFVI